MCLTLNLLILLCQSRGKSAGNALDYKLLWTEWHRKYYPTILSRCQRHVTSVGLSIMWQRLKREGVSVRVHDLLALDKSILKSPIKIISLDSSQTESIIQIYLSIQLAGSDGLRYKKLTRMGEDFFIFTSSHTHSIPYFSYRVRRLKETCSLIYNEACFFPM